MKTPLLEKWRGPILESVHTGRYAVFSGTRLVGSRGDVDMPAYLRSSAKPFQAWCVVESGAPDEYGFDARELSLICGSHYGEEIHVRTVRSILRKAGLRPSHLQCGVHPPISADTQRALARNGGRPSVLHNNCSGKHAGMVAAARRMGASLAAYLRPDHPLQRANLRAVAAFAGVRPSSIRIAVDGCSAPTFGLPMTAFARAFASLAAPRLDASMERVVRAMTAHPEMVGHPCEELMRAARGRIVGKVGAEGVYGLAVLGRGVGLAVKVDDGSTQPLLRIVVGLVRRYGLLEGRELAALDRLAGEEIRNHAGRVVGRTRVVLD